MLRGLSPTPRSTRPRMTGGGGGGGDSGDDDEKDYSRRPTMTMKTTVHDTIMEKRQAQVVENNYQKILWSSLFYSTMTPLVLLLLLALAPRQKHKRRRCQQLCIPMVCLTATSGFRISFIFYYPSTTLNLCLSWLCYAAPYYFTLLFNIAVFTFSNPTQRCNWIGWISTVVHHES